ncbi:uncharacterized protein LOC143955722 [Lithobates pipiens]
MAAEEGEELKDLNIEIKEEEEEERLVSGDQQSMEEGETIMESKREEPSLHEDTNGSSNGNPPERCARPLYSRDSTQEGHTIPHHHQGEELKDLNIKIKEEEERLVSGGQQSMEEEEMTMKTEREDSSLYIDTSGHYARNISEAHPTLSPGRNTNDSNAQHFPGVNFIIQNTQSSTDPSNPQKSSDVSHAVTPETPLRSRGMERSADPSDSKKPSLHTGESSLSCSVCGKSFSKNKDRLNHQKTHAEERSYPCSKCGLCFAKEAHLLTHQKFHMGKPPYLCSECGKSFSQKNNFLIHLRIHTGERPYSCSECGKSFSRIEELQKHQKVHTGGNYAKNISEEHSILPPGRNANYNNAQPGANVIIQNAQRSTDPSNPPESSDVSHTVTLETHPVSHSMEGSSDTSNPKKKSSLRTGESSLSCSVCGKSFSKNRDRLNHQKTHTDQRSYPCSKCGLCFAKEAQLLTHLRFHMGEPSYSCSECGKSFKQKNDLLIHLRVHTGERPSSSSECGKSFNRIEELQKHQKVHTGERPYKCSECGKCFSQRDGLLAHQRTHKPYSS